MKDVEITREPIELHKLLKFEGLAASGGEAKTMIAAGRVLLNGVLETQKRKKLVSGDCIEIGETKLTLRLIETPDQP
ncbi:MAG: ribosome-associated protein [Lentimonas sp.]|jgi:ribosome-associated protein